MAQAGTKREFDASWPQVWQVAGRIDQVPRPGDYVTSAIGRDSVVAVRSSDAEGRVFDNVCQYRGNHLLQIPIVLREPKIRRTQQWRQRQE